MGRTVDSFRKLERQLEITKIITRENWKEISENYGLSINTVRLIYFKSKNKKKMRELKVKIEEYNGNFNSFTQEEVDEEIKYIILKYERENRDIKEICELLNRNSSEIEKIIDRRYKNKNVKERQRKRKLI